MAIIIVAHLCNEAYVRFFLLNEIRVDFGIGRLVKRIHAIELSQLLTL